MTLVGEEVVSEPAALVQARDKLTGAVSCVGTGFETYGETLGGLADVLMPSGAFPAAADMLPLARQAWLRVRRCRLSKPPLSICVTR
jgi:tRNA threonylcarbamoyladenosine biosynthesis protein TsaB